MADSIHKRITPDGVHLYRVWESTVDRYETPELTREECAEQLYQWELDRIERMKDNIRKEVETRLDRADKKGTSLIPGVFARDLYGPWDIETCEICFLSHHSFRPLSNATCQYCGEEESDPAHGEAGPDCFKGGLLWE